MVPSTDTAVQQEKKETTASEVKMFGRVKLFKAEGGEDWADWIIGSLRVTECANKDSMSSLKFDLEIIEDSEQHSTHLTIDACTDLTRQQGTCYIFIISPLDTVVCWTMQGDKPSFSYDLAMSFENIVQCETFWSLIEKNFKREVAKDSSKSNFSSPLASSSPSMLQSSVVSKMTVEDIPKLALGRQAMLARQIAERGLVEQALIQGHRAALESLVLSAHESILTILLRPANYERLVRVFTSNEARVEQSNNSVDDVNLSSRFKQVIPLSDVLQEAIHEAFRLMHLRDTLSVPFLTDDTWSSLTMLLRSRHMRILDMLGETGNGAILGNIATTRVDAANNDLYRLILCTNNALGEGISHSISSKSLSIDQICFVRELHALAGSTVGMAGPRAAILGHLYNRQSESLTAFLYALVRTIVGQENTESASTLAADLLVSYAIQDVSLIRTILLLADNDSITPLQSLFKKATDFLTARALKMHIIHLFRLIMSSTTPLSTMGYTPASTLDMLDGMLLFSSEPNPITSQQSAEIPTLSNIAESSSAIDFLSSLYGKTMVVNEMIEYLVNTLTLMQQDTCLRVLEINTLCSFMDILGLMVSGHRYRIKYLILRAHLVPTMLSACLSKPFLAKSQQLEHSCVILPALASIRLVKTMLATGDDFYVRLLTRVPLLDVLLNLVKEATKIILPDQVNFLTTKNGEPSALLCSIVSLLTDLVRMNKQKENRESPPPLEGDEDKLKQTIIEIVDQSCMARLKQVLLIENHQGTPPNQPSPVIASLIAKAIEIN